MNEIQIFNYNDNQVRTIEINGEPWFVLKDVCQILSIGNAADVYSRLDEDEKGVGQIDTLGGCQKMNIINESGLYNVIIRSDKKEAKPFRKWVTSEVLPSIRKHGIYATQNTIEQMLADPDTAIKLLTTLKEERAARREAEHNMQLLELDNRRMRPMADYFRACVDKNMLTSLRETAKLFRVKEKHLIRFLIDNRYLYRAPSGKLLPYATRPAEDLFVVKEVHNEKTGWFGTQVFVTPRGRETFRLLLQGEPESSLWGSTSHGLPKEMTEGERYRMEEYYRKTARKQRKSKN